MLGLILRVVAFLLFVIAALNQTLLDQSPTDLAYWALAAWVLSTLLGDPIVTERFTRGRP